MDAPALVYVYARETANEANIAGVLSFDEERRIAVNVAGWVFGPLDAGDHHGRQDQVERDELHQWTVSSS